MHHPIRHPVYGYKTGNLGASSQMLHCLAFSILQGSFWSLARLLPEFWEAVEKAKMID